jgi:hypothetical protein
VIDQVAMNGDPTMLAPQRQKFTQQSLVFLLQMLKMPALFSEAAA